MRYSITDTQIYDGNGFIPGNVLVDEGRILDLLPAGETPEAKRLSFPGAFLFPGFIDVHVHFREPGFSWKETIASGTRAAAHGGYTTVCAMPNLSPVPDSPASIRLELEAIANSAAIRVLPYGAITAGQSGETLADLEGLAPLVFAFSDDGRGVQNNALMHEAMRKAKALGRIIVAHCEDEALLPKDGVCIHPGAYAQKLGLAGYPAESEWQQIERDLALAKETGCAYHVCHISCKESVALLRRAKAEGLDVSCETTPHYLLLDDSMLEDEGRFKMNPPIRSEADRLSLLAGLLDGTIDMIATDHAPHTAKEKAGGFCDSLNGVVGLETAFPALYTALVRTGKLSLSTLLARMQKNPAQRFGLKARIAKGMPADLCIYDLGADYTVDPVQFLSMGKSSPFTGWRVYGKCLLTMAEGRIVWQEEGNKI